MNLLISTFHSYAKDIKKERVKKKTQITTFEDAQKDSPPSLI